MSAVRIPIANTDFTEAQYESISNESLQIDAPFGAEKGPVYNIVEPPSTETSGGPYEYVPTTDYQRVTPSGGMAQPVYNILEPLSADTSNGSFECVPIEEHLKEAQPRELEPPVYNILEPPGTDGPYEYVPTEEYQNKTPLGAFEQREYNFVEPLRTKHTDDKPDCGPDKTISTTPLSLEKSVYSLIEDINPGNYQGETQDSVYNVLKKPLSDGAEAVDRRGVRDQLDPLYNVLYRGPSSVVNRHLIPMGAFEQRKYINLVEPLRTEHTDDKRGYGPDKTISTTPINVEKSVHSLIEDINPGNYQGETQDSVYNVLKKPLSDDAEAVDRRGVSDQLDPLYNVLYRGPSSVGNRHL